MTVSVGKFNQVLNSSIGTTTYFKRAGSNGLVYTDGIMALQKECDMCWFVDVVYSHFHKVIEDYNKTRESIYFVKMEVAEDSSAVFKIVREEYTEENENGFVDIVVAEQEIPYVDLPQVSFTLYIELADVDPVLFLLLSPSEH